MLNILKTRKKTGLSLNYENIVKCFFSQTKNSESNRLDPNWVTGIVDAEGSFIVFVKTISSSPTENIKHLVRQVQASFEISFHVRDLDLLYKIKSFFGGAGNISIPSNREAAVLKITKLDDIVNILIPHFKKYPLQGAKKIDFDLWEQCIELIKNKKHLEEEGLNRLLSIKSVLNKGLSDKLKAIFPSVKPIDRPLLEVVNIPLNPDYVSGFTEGDGCFSVTISSKTNQVISSYRVDLHNREIALLNRIQNYFGGIGRINATSLRNSACFNISKKRDLVNLVIPHFDTYKLQGHKLKNYLIWKEIVLMVNSKAHLTQEGLNRIKLLQEGLNK